MYEPASELCKLAGRQPVYIKDDLAVVQDKKQQLETQEKRIRSLVIETPIIPSQLDIGFYLHRKAPN